MSELKIQERREPQRNNGVTQRNKKLCGSPFHSAALRGPAVCLHLKCWFRKDIVKKRQQLFMIEAQVVKY